MEDGSGLGDKAEVEADCCAGSASLLGFFLGILPMPLILGASNGAFLLSMLRYSKS